MLAGPSTAPGEWQNRSVVEPSAQAAKSQTRREPRNLGQVMDGCAGGGKTRLPNNQQLTPIIRQTNGDARDARRKRGQQDSFRKMTSSVMHSTVCICVSKTTRAI